MNWTSKAVTALLSNVKQRRYQLLPAKGGTRSKQKTAATWALIAGEVSQAYGVAVTPAQCSDKWSNLQRAVKVRRVADLVSLLICSCNGLI